MILSEAGIKGDMRFSYNPGLQARKALRAFDGDRLNLRFKRSGWLIWLQQNYTRRAAEQGGFKFHGDESMARL
jgi:hypothetical protein